MTEPALLRSLDGQTADFDGMWMAPAEAAAKLGISLTQLYEWAKADPPLFPCRRVGDGNKAHPRLRLLIHRAAFERFLVEGWGREVEPPPPPTPSPAPVPTVEAREGTGEARVQIAGTDGCLITISIAVQPAREGHG